MSGAPGMPSGKDDPKTDGGDSLAGNTVSLRPSVFFSEQTSEAIASVQMGQKLLLVYIAGVDEDSRKLDQITWNDPKVIEVLSQQCVALCLRHNSSDAAHFKAMYPYHEIPTVAIISPAGLLLKQHGGYVAPSEFLVSVEQATAMLYLQNAVTTVASLASAGVGSSTPDTLLGGQSEVENLPPTGDVSRSEKACSSISCDSREISEQTCATSRILSPPSDEMDRESVRAPQVSEASGLDASAQGGFDDGFERHESPNFKLPLGKKSFNSGSILLQIRLTNGENLRKDFSIEDSLAVVRDFVDYNRTDGNTNYSLAISYPRKIFNNEDMEKSLLDLNLQDRATLILVTNRVQETHMDSGQPVAHASTSEMNGAGSSIVWKLLSYLNPFAYFTGRSADTNESSSGTSSWQYSPNTSLPKSRDGEQNLLGPGSSSSNSANGEVRNRRSNGPQDGRWGGNIHTLPNDDDSGVFKNRNAFWNGNSTQYGGDDSKNS